jgi:hypothetical protein
VKLLTGIAASPEVNRSKEKPAPYVTPSKPISEFKAVFGQQQFSFIHHSKIIFSYRMISLTFFSLPGYHFGAIPVKRTYG